MDSNTTSSYIQILVEVSSCLILCPHDALKCILVITEWLSGDANSGISWSTQTTGDIVYHQFTLSSPVQYGQSDGRVQYGNGYHAILYDDQVTYQTASDVILRFVHHGAHIAILTFRAEQGSTRPAG